MRKKGSWKVFLRECARKKADTLWEIRELKQCLDPMVLGLSVQNHLVRPGRILCTYFNSPNDERGPALWAFGFLVLFQI